MLLARHRSLLLGWAWVGCVLATGTWISGCRWAMLDRHYLYYPMAWESRDWEALSGLPLEEVWLTTSDGVRLFGWYVEAPDRRAVLLWCHGNAGNITHRLENLRELYRRGLSVLIFDYRGYGRSEGQPSEEGLYQDGLAAYEYLVQERKIHSTELVVFGRSLGAAVAGEVVWQREVAGLILETPFPSVEAAARTIFNGWPMHKLLEARFDLAGRLKDIQVPVLVLHGDQDDVIPFELGEAVYGTANAPKQFYRIRGAGHNNTYLVGGEPYFQQVVGFVHEVARPTASE